MGVSGRDTQAIHKSRPALLIGLGVGALISLAAFFDFNSTLENKLLDLRFLNRPAAASHARDEVVIVAIDDQSLERLGLRWPWPRTAFVKAIDRLSQAGARVIALDFMFSEPSQGELQSQDRLLGESIQRSRAWVVLASKFYQKKMTIGEQTAYVAPIPHIDPGKTHVGYVDMWNDSDGIIRHAALVRKHLNKLYQSFPLKILNRYYGLKSEDIHWGGGFFDYGSLHIPVDPGANLLINFRGGPGNFKIISFENLLDDEVFQGLVATSVFRDKIVLVGPTFSEAQDDHATPYLADGRTSGVEVHANTLETLLTHDFLRRLPEGLAVLLMLVLSVLLALATIRLKPWRSLVLLAAAVLVYGVLAFWLFIQLKLILPMANPVLAMLLTYLVVMMYRVLTEERRSRQIKTIFSRYVSPKVVDELVKNPNMALHMGGNKQQVTVLFSDIRGFTSLSEQLSPEKIVELLNEYFEAMTQVIFSQDGMVDKFIGDAVMAIFGAPVAHADDPARAVRAAVLMHQELERLRAQWEAKGRKTFRIGVGINTGEAILGNMGSTRAMDYTVIGDTVNLASRLESLNKELGTSILISESTYAAVKDWVEVKEFTGVTVKGKAQPLKVYAVLSCKDKPEAGACAGAGVGRGSTG